MSEPLYLRVIEARLNVLNACGSDPCNSPDCESARLALDLLAVLRETRAKAQAYLDANEIQTQTAASNLRYELAKVRDDG